MAIVDSRIRHGALTLGGVSFACQAKSVTFTPPDIPSGDDDEEVLCGDPLPPEGGGDSAWKLGAGVIQDFDNPDGLIQYLIDHMGEEVPATFRANDISGFGASCTVKVWPGVIGGDVKKRLESTLELPVTSGKPAFTRSPAPLWTAATPYVISDRVKLSTGETLRATVGGTSDDTEPVAPGAVGGTVVDGTVTWERIG